MSPQKILQLLVFVCSLTTIWAQELTLSDEVEQLISETRQLVSVQSFEEALNQIELAKQMSKDTLPILFARCLYNYGRTYLYALEYSKAIPFFEEALTIQEKEIGQQTADFAYSLTGLANALRELGQYERAMPLYIKSKNIRREVLGVNHSSYASAVNNLAILHWEMGAFDKTEKLLLESKRIRHETMGADHPDYASSLFNLAILYDDMGAYEKAADLLLQSIDIIKLNLGDKHPDYASALQALATVYFHDGKYKQAENYYIDGINAWAAVYGKNNEDYLLFQANLAELYLKKNEYDKAEHLFKEILTNQDQLSDKNPNLNANALYNLGSFYWDTKQYEKVAPLYEQCKAIMENVLSREHPKYSMILNSLADIYELENKWDTAEKLLIEASELQQTRLKNAVGFLSENELAKYTKVFEKDLFRMLHVLHIRSENQYELNQLGGLCFDNILFYKGFLLTAVQQLRTLVSSNEVASNLHAELKGHKRLLAKVYATPKLHRDSLELINIESKVNTLEKELAGAVSGFEQSKKQVGWKDVQANLKASELAVEFIQYISSTPEDSSTVYYGAFIIRPSSQQPQFVPLFEESKLFDILNTYSKPSSSSLNKLYARGAVPIRQSNLDGLYDLIWKPIESFAHQVQTIYYSPSGLLHRISFDALPTDRDQRLSDHFQLVRLGSTRSLAFTKSEFSNDRKEAVLYGGIVYDFNEETNDNKLLALETERPERDAIAEFTRAQVFQNEKWSYLKGTEMEVTDIADLLKVNGFTVKTHMEKNGTESSFKKLGTDKPSPRILHIATHGYFYPDPKYTTVKKEEHLAFKTSAHPLIRSGLLLAGANHAWSSVKQRIPSNEDGIVTAYEISQMDLTNTELVALSACETGLGDILGNEGVYGLQRALKIAGAKNLIISLWKVPDQETAQLMTAFYTYWLQDNLTIREALNRAQRDFREAGYDPYFWAGFILLE